MWKLKGDKLHLMADSHKEKESFFSSNMDGFFILSPSPAIIEIKRQKPSKLLQDKANHNPWRNQQLSKSEES